MHSGRYQNMYLQYRGSMKKWIKEMVEPVIGARLVRCIYFVFNTIFYFIRQNTYIYKIFTSYMAKVAVLYRVK